MPIRIHQPGTSNTGAEEIEMLELGQAASDAPSPESVAPVQAMFRSVRPVRPFRWASPVSLTGVSVISSKVSSVRPSRYGCQPGVAHGRTTNIELP